MYIFCVYIICTIPFLAFPCRTQCIIKSYTQGKEYREKKTSSERKKKEHSKTSKQLLLVESVSMHIFFRLYLLKYSIKEFMQHIKHRPTKTIPQETKGMSRINSK